MLPCGLKKPIFKKKEEIKRKLIVGEEMKITFLILIDVEHNIYLRGIEKEKLDDLMARTDLKPSLRDLFHWAKSERECTTMADVMKLSTFEVFTKAREFKTIRASIIPECFEGSEDDYKKIENTELVPLKVPPKTPWFSYK